MGRNIKGNIAFVRAKFSSTRDRFSVGQWTCSLRGTFKELLENECDFSVVDIMSLDLGVTIDEKTVASFNYFKTKIN